MASHKNLSNWYAQLGQQLEAGVPLSDALRLSQGLPQPGRDAMADQLEAGDPPCEVLARAPQWLPRADRQFLLAGMETGSLGRTLSNLSDRHASIGATQMKLLLGSIYPLIVILITALLLPIARMINYEHGLEWSLGRYLLESTVFILPIWLLVAAILYLVRSDSPLLPRILRTLPVLRAYSQQQAMADLAYALGTFLAAGIPAPSAWRLSAKLVNDPRYNQAIAQLEPCFTAGQDPSIELHRFKCFPADFKAFYSTGAQSGQLEGNLLKAGRQYQERANRTMTLASILYPTLVLATIAMLVIYIIFNVFSGYLNALDGITG